MEGADTALVTLVVTRADGTPVRHLLRDVARPANADLSWAGTLSLKPGTYRYVAYATVDGRPQRVAVPATLTVTVPAFPNDKAVAAAIAWIKGRSGAPGLAVITSDGELHGVRLNTQYQSYSLSKAMMLVAYLRAHATISDAMRDTMTRMIENSDNGAADVMYREVGGAVGLTRLARTVGMQRFTAGGGWISTRVTPADQARFFYDMETYIPQRHRAFARQLLSGITAASALGSGRRRRTAGLEGLLQGRLVRRQRGHGAGRPAAATGADVGRRRHDHGQPRMDVRVRHAQGRDRRPARAAADRGLPHAGPRVGSRRRGRGASG